MEIDGLDEFADELEEIGERAESLEGEQEVPVEDLLTSQFMRCFTEFDSFESMIEASAWDVETQEDFEAIPEAPWDAFVAERTQFSDWESLLGRATTEWTNRQLGLG